MQIGVAEAIQSPGGREAALTALHAADSRLVFTQDAYVTATLLQNLGPVILTKDAVLRFGTLLIVKIDWSLQVIQLTAAQQAVLDHQPDLAMRSHEIVQALRLPTAEEEAEEETVQTPPEPATGGSQIGSSAAISGAYDTGAYE
jgi:hypothetical protein